MYVLAVTTSEDLNMASWVLLCYHLNNVYTYTSNSWHTCTHTHILTHTHMHAHIYAHTHMYTYTCTHTWTYTRIHTHTQTPPTHTHMHPPPPPHTHTHTGRRASISKSKHLPMVPNPIYAGPVYETVTQNIRPLPNQNFAPPSPYGNIPTSPAAEPSLDSKFTHFNPEAAVQCNENIDVLTAIIPSSVMSEDNYTVMRSPTSTAPPVQPEPAEHENTTMRYVQDPTVTDL